MRVLHKIFPNTYKFGASQHGVNYSFSAHSTGKGQCAGKGCKERMCFRDYGLLPVRLPGKCGYLVGEDFMHLEDLKANCKWEWTCDTVFGDYDSVCNNFGGAIGNWWSRGKSWS